MKATELNFETKWLLILSIKPYFENSLIFLSGSHCFILMPCYNITFSNKYFTQPFSCVILNVNIGQKGANARK